MKRWLLLLISGLFLTACGTNNTPPEMAAPLDVMLQVQPPAPAASDQVTFSVLVKQADEPVNDANEVKFEIWPSGQDEHEFLDATRTADGSYTVTKQFVEPGTYFVMYHVTARDIHSMEKLQFVVGTGK
ncbi:MAG: FixH family protein [Clostridia bacterium]